MSNDPRIRFRSVTTWDEAFQCAVDNFPRAKFVRLEHDGFAHVGRDRCSLKGLSVFPDGDMVTVYGYQAGYHLQERISGTSLTMMMSPADAKQFAYQILDLLKEQEAER